MGISVLKDGEYTKLSDVGRDVVDMMDGAAGFMSDTLSDVLSMTKLEDRLVGCVLLLKYNHSPQPQPQPHTPFQAMAFYLSLHDYLTS